MVHMLTLLIHRIELQCRFWYKVFELHENLIKSFELQQTLKQQFELQLLQIRPQLNSFQIGETLN